MTAIPEFVDKAHKLTWLNSFLFFLHRAQDFVLIYLHFSNYVQM